MKTINLSSTKFVYSSNLLRYLILACLLIAPAVGFTQEDFKSEVTLNTIFYDSIINSEGYDSLEGKGYKQFMRRYRYWSSKLSDNYDFSDYQASKLSRVDAYSSPSQGSGEQKWHLIGPNDVPQSGNNAKGTGQIHYIVSDDDNGTNLLACSPVGGVFKKQSGFDSWMNFGTDKGLPQCGVSSIVSMSYPTEPLSCYFVTTGNGEGFDGEKAWQTSIGVYRSTDNGSTWENIGLQTDPTDTSYIYHNA